MTLTKLIQMTDLHLTPERGETVYEIDVWACFERVLQLVAAEQPDQLILTGDLVDQPSPEAYHLLAGRLNELKIPTLAIAGNHDDPAMLEECLSGDLIQRVERFEISGWTLRFVDTFVAGQHGGLIAENQFEQLQNESVDGPQLIFMHHHPFKSGSPWMDEMNAVHGERLLELFAEIQNDHAVVVACGHIHQALSGWHNGVRYLSTPATCDQAIPFTDSFISDSRGPGYRRFELSTDGAWCSSLVRLPESAKAVA